MKSRVAPDILTLFKELRFVGTKDDVAAKVFCTSKTAWRNLVGLHARKTIYVKSWVRRNGGPTQVFALRDKGQNDAPKPTPKTTQQKAADRRATAESRERINAMQRIYRSVGREVRIGIWGV